jgi:hypothetical protein
MKAREHKDGPSRRTERGQEVYAKDDAKHGQVWHGQPQPEHVRIRVT